MSKFFKDINSRIIYLPDDSNSISFDFSEDIITGNIEGYYVHIVDSEFGNVVYEVDETTYTAVENYKKNL